MDLFCFNHKTFYVFNCKMHVNIYQHFSFKNMKRSPKTINSAYLSASATKIHEICPFLAVVSEKIPLTCLVKKYRERSYEKKEKIRRPRGERCLDHCLRRLFPPPVAITHAATPHRHANRAIKQRRSRRDVPVPSARYTCGTIRHGTLSRGHRLP